MQSKDNNEDEANDDNKYIVITVYDKALQGI